MRVQQLGSRCRVNVFEIVIHGSLKIHMLTTSNTAVSRDDEDYGDGDDGAADDGDIDPETAAKRLRSKLAARPRIKRTSSDTQPALSPSIRGRGGRGSRGGGRGRGFAAANRPGRGGGRTSSRGGRGGSRPRSSSGLPGIMPGRGGRGGRGQFAKGLRLSEAAEALIGMGVMPGEGESLTEVSTHLHRCWRSA